LLVSKYQAHFLGVLDFLFFFANMLENRTKRVFYVAL